MSQKLSKLVSLSKLGCQLTKVPLAAAMITYDQRHLKIALFHGNLDHKGQAAACIPPYTRNLL